MNVRRLKRLTPVLLVVMAAIPAPAQQRSSTGADLGERVRTLIRQGRIEQAVKLTQQVLRSRPHDAKVRGEFIDLHLVLARRYLRSEQFTAAEKLLQAVTKVDPHHPVARKYLAGIAQARRAAPGRAAEAANLIEIELFEPALAILRQAEGLLPGQSQQWAGSLRRAMRGAADDDYLCRNFARAAGGYAALAERYPDAAKTVADRWVVSMVAAMADQVAAERFVPGDWLRPVSRAVPIIQARGNQTAFETLSGLAAEGIGKTSQAAGHYLRALGRPGDNVASASRSGVAALREKAVARVLERFDPAAVGRRSGPWALALSGPRRIRQTPHFRIHHRNDLAAQRVGQALEYHWPRLIRFLGGDPAAVAWPEKADVFVYESAEALAHATRRPRGAAGVTSMQAVDRHLVARTIHLHQADPLLLSGTVPHELVHLLAATLYGAQPVAPLLGEGLACQAEPPARRRMYRRRLSRESRPPDLAALLHVGGPTHGRTPRFYAQAWSFVDFLLATRPRKTVVRFCTQTPPADTAKQLLDLFGWGDLAEAQAQWQAHIQRYSSR